MKQISSIFTLFILLLAGMICFIACHKEYSYEGGPKKSPAVYTLVGAGASCTGSVIAGKYYMGKVLTAANTIQLQVNVVTTGAYSVSTNTANGIRFSASGNFINTGTQNIILTGIGTPAATGDFIFTATAASTGCTFSVTFMKEPVTMAGFSVDCSKTDVNGLFVAGNKAGISNFTMITVAVTATGPYTITSDTLDGIYFSASGTFSSTGNKTLMLKAYGTPDLARNLVFTLSVNGATCTFNVTVTDSQPLAVYVLESGFSNNPAFPSGCISLVSGNYTSGTTLSATNTVKMDVYVTELGNFTVSTATVNGMTFSYSGSFTTTGHQTITLQGSGTPAASGSSVFLPEIVGPHPLGGERCGFEVTVL